MKKPVFIENKIYHVYNRGVEKRKIFLDEKDYFRFVHNLFELNDEDPVFNITYHFNPKAMTVEPHRVEKERKKRKLLVEILAFVQMPNHFHLLLRQERRNGIVKFMQKLGTAYSMYFNKKQERVGSLFQGPFKAVAIEKEPHFIHLPFYLHLNPLEIKFPGWKNYRGLTSIDWREAMEFLRNYRWSSFLDYIGQKNFPSVTQRDFLLEFFGGPEEYKKATEAWLKERGPEEIKDLLLE